MQQEQEREIYNSKIEFFTMIAHEIRTPVSLIIGLWKISFLQVSLYPKVLKKSWALLIGTVSAVESSQPVTRFPKSRTRCFYFLSEVSYL
jgi:signal transduction histidine kinase